MNHHAEACIVRDVEASLSLVPAGSLGGFSNSWASSGRPLKWADTSATMSYFACSTRTYLRRQWMQLDHRRKTTLQKVCISTTVMGTFSFIFLLFSGNWYDRLLRVRCNFNLCWYLLLSCLFSGQPSLYIFLALESSDLDPSNKLDVSWAWLSELCFRLKGSNRISSSINARTKEKNGTWRSRLAWAASPVTHLWLAHPDPFYHLFNTHPPPLTLSSLGQALHWPCIWEMTGAVLRYLSKAAGEQWLDCHH